MRPSPYILLLVALGLAGCKASSSAPGEIIQGAGAGLDYRDTGPFAVASHAVWAPARYTDVVTATVHYPSDDAGYIYGSEGARPLVILIHEEGQDPRLFHWLSLHLASWGMVVAIPDHILDDPALASDNARWVRAELLDLSTSDQTWLSAGLDAGRIGLTRFNVSGDAIQTLDEDDTYQTLSLVGAEPRSPSTSPITATVLAIDGSQDCVADPTVGWANYETHRYLATLEGLSHSQLTDASALGPNATGNEDCEVDAESCDAQSCGALISDPEARRRIRGVAAAFHAVELARDDTQPLVSTVGDWTGLTLQESTPTPSP